MMSSASDARPLVSEWIRPSPGSSPTAWQARIASASTRARGNFEYRVERSSAFRSCTTRRGPIDTLVARPVRWDASPVPCGEDRHALGPSRPGAEVEACRRSFDLADLVEVRRLFDTEGEVADRLGSLDIGNRETTTFPWPTSLREISHRATSSPYGSRELEPVSCAAWRRR